MRLWKIVMLIGTALLCSLLLCWGVGNFKKIPVTKMPVVKSEHEITLKSIPNPRILNKDDKNALWKMIGESSKTLEDQFGKPIRKDLSAYGYTWWVYPRETSYIQFGVANEKVVTIYGVGDISLGPISLGDTYKELNAALGFTKQLDFQKNKNSYQLNLSKKELKAKPIVQIAEEVWMQLYFDTFTNKLTAVRFITSETLVKQRFYAMKYRGKLLKEEQISKEKWKKIERGMEQQIFYITNQLRRKQKLSELKWSKQISRVAYQHSKDMNRNQYFSHYDEDGNGLKERLEEESIFYVAAGENIAAFYPDAPAAVAGWLNSKGHRDALFNKTYTHLGVGVYQKYYTQNFLQVP